MTVVDTSFRAFPGLTDLVLGTDLVYVPRLARSQRRFGAGLFARILTERERAYCGDLPAGLLRRAAGKIAVKEAVSKALGIGMSGLGWSQGAAWKEIEVLSERRRPPGLCLSGKALAGAEVLGISEWRISLSHDGDYAMATVIGLIKAPSDR